MLYKKSICQNFFQELVLKAMATARLSIGRWVGVRGWELGGGGGVGLVVGPMVEH
jgi:hypothetical protein